MIDYYARILIQSQKYSSKILNEMDSISEVCAVASLNPQLSLIHKWQMYMN